MNREGAETYLRLLGEARMRGWLEAVPRPPWAAGLGSSRTRMMAVGLALAAVGALDLAILEEILADFNLAVNVRQIHERASQGPPGPGQGAGLGPGQGAGQGGGFTGPSPGGPRRGPAIARWTAQSRTAGSGPLGRAARLPPAPPPRRARSSEPEEADPPGPDRGESDRFVAVGLTVPYRDEGLVGDLYLMSYAQTGSGARFLALWGVRTPSLQHLLGLERPDLVPLGGFTVTDDRGARYDLEFAPGSGPEWTSEISLHPAPPGDIRWLEVAPPHGPAARVDLRAANGTAPAPQVSEAELSPGELLLTMLAERLLTTAPEFAGNLLRPQRATSPGPLRAMACALGDIVGALEAADVLSPLSPVPARLAALCVSLGIDEHGIAVPPAHDLPEPWLSLLAHYQRRKPDTAPVRDGFAAMAAVLPELDGIRLALLGLHNTEGSSSVYVLARGMTAEGRPAPLGVDLDFPLSIWLRDGGGRWHAACPAGWHRPGPGHRECTIRLRLMPPLPRSTPWVELLAGGRSAEVRARLPLRWGFPS
jgi:hypothetical protein